MPHRFLRLAGALSLCLLLGAQSPKRPDDATLKPAASALRAALDARAAGSSPAEARARLVTALVELAKVDGGRHPLEESALLGRALWLSRSGAQPRPRRGKVTEETAPHGALAGGALEYAYRLPKDYDPDGAGYPLILTVHDEGERPADHLRDHWSSNEVRDGAIVVAPHMPAERAEWDRVMVSGRPGGLCHVLTALRLATERFAVDPDRVFVAGRGKGVPAALAAADYGPQRFAGVIGVAGDSGPLGPNNFGNLPTLFIGGGAEAEAFRDASKALGNESCSLLPIGGETEAWDWIGGRTRVRAPERVTVDVGDPFPTRAYWLRVAPTDPAAEATATLDRAANAVTIEATGVSVVTLYLNDELLDLDEPIKLTAGGETRSLSVDRRLSTALNLIDDGTSDAGCVYVVQLLVDLRDEESRIAAGPPVGADDEFRRRRKEASADAGSLWGVYEWCVVTQRQAGAFAALRKIVRLDPDHEEARAALDHVKQGEHWFTTPEAAAVYAASQDPKLAAARGWVESNGTWMHPDHRSLASKGRSQDPESGLWLNPAERRQLAEGWVRQDLTWISPAEAENVDDGLWLVDGEWVDLPTAEQQRARIDGHLRIPTAEVLLHSTTGRATSRLAHWHMSRAMNDLRKVFGAEPPLPLEVVILRDEEQYDRFAFGDPDGRRAPAHVGRQHTIRSAVFAESWYPREAGKRRFSGMGACYWDSWIPYGDLYGVHSARLAIGFSYVDALDPSPKAVRKSDEPDYFEAYEAEKSLPAWLRYGGAVYAERFFRDDTVGPDGDRWWARNWSLDNLRKRGGLRPLAEVFAFELDPNDREEGIKRMIEAGLLVAYLVDGDDALLMEQHAALKRSLIAGTVKKSQLRELEAALQEREAALRAFAEL